jgi:drug/metabolite transporter (DMT)-like permease
MRQQLSAHTTTASSSRESAYTEVNRPIKMSAAVAGISSTTQITRDANVHSNITPVKETLSIAQFKTQQRLSSKELSPGVIGLLKGALAVALFSLTVPMTKIALTGFTPETIAAARVLIAGLFSLTLIRKLSARLPNRQETFGLAIAGLGICLGFPYGVSVALQEVSAANMGVALAALPLLTAIIAVLITKERHNLGFWLSALLGFATLAHFFGNGLEVALPASLLATLISAAMGYAVGAKVAKTLGGWQTICWMMILYLPVSALAFGYSFDQVSSDVNNLGFNVPAALALIYLALISQWLGFHFWYDGMAKAGISRVSQLQLLQPFMTLVFAAVLLGETLEWSQLGYVAIIAACVFGAIRFR